MNRILIVEDDCALNDGIRLSPAGEQYEISQAYDLATSRELVADSAFDLVILDVNLPDGSGIDFCQELLLSSATAVILLTASAHEPVKQIGVQADKLKFLIESLVKTSRLEGGMLAVRPVQAELDPLLAAAGEEYRQAAAAKSLTLELPPPSGLSAVFDCKWTLEALCNLLDNAVKYTPPGTCHQAWDHPG